MVGLKRRLIDDAHYHNTMFYSVVWSEHKFSPLVLEKIEIFRASFCLEANYCEIKGYDRILKIGENMQITLKQNSLEY